MIADIIKKKKQILLKIKEAGIPRDNLYSVLLYGSHYWGYDTLKSDIDLYILVKKQQQKVKDINNISLHYQITPQQLNEKIKSGSWASYFCCKYASYLLYGEKPNVVNYSKENIIDYLKKHKEDEIDVLFEKNRKWAFQTLLKRLFFINYFINDIKTFKITDFQRCNQLEKSQLLFLEEQYVKIFKHEKELRNDISKLKDIILKIEEIIKSYIKNEKVSNN